MLKITMLDTTGRAPVALFSVVAASVQIRTEFLEIHVTDPMQETILRGKLIEYNVQFRSDTGNDDELFTVDLERTDFEFRVEGVQKSARTVGDYAAHNSQHMRGDQPGWKVAVKHPSGDGSFYAAIADGLTERQAEIIAEALNTADSHA